MKRPRKFIFDRRTMDDSDFPLVGSSMWIATRTVVSGGEAYIEPYRFLLDQDEIDLTRAFIAPPSVIEPISHIFSGALLLVGDFDPEIASNLRSTVVTMVFDHRDLFHFGPKIHDLSAEFSLEKIIDYVIMKYQRAEDEERERCRVEGLNEQETLESFYNDESLTQICAINSFFRHLSPTSPIYQKSLS